MSRRLLAFLPIGLAIACTGEPADTAAPTPTDTGTVVEDPTPWEYTEDSGAADHTLAQLQEGFDVGLAALAALDDAVLYQGYSDAMSRGTRECPGTYPAVGVTIGWSNECTTPEGWGYAGRGQAAWAPNMTVEGQVYAPYGEFINTSVITHPSGATLSMDGRGDYRAWTDGTQARFTSSLLGTFAFTGTGEEGWLPASWLDGGPSVGMEVERLEDGTLRTVEIEGGVAYTGALSDGMVGVRAEGLTVWTDGTCGGWGAIVLLGDEGQRYRLTLPDDGPCDPCADVTRADRVIGEVCVDLSPFVTWEERPW